MENARCRVCDGPLAFALTAREMMLGTREAFDYFECRACGCLQIGEPPGSLDAYYPSSYYTHAPQPEHGRDGIAPGWRRGWSRLRLREGRLVRALSGRRYARFDWFRRTGTGLHDPILDVGCGSGRLLRRLARDGFDRLTGIDPHLPSHLASVAAPDREGPIRLERNSLEAHRGRYRLVMAHHSFEHLPDPRAAFEAFAELVEPGGHLLLRVPVADGWARRRYGADWVQLDAPRHLYLHTRRSISVLAEGAGLRIVDVVDDSGPFQIWGSELYRRDVPLVEAGRGGRRALGVGTRLAARARAHGLRRRGLGDQLCFYLQRPERTDVSRG